MIDVSKLPKDWAKQVADYVIPGDEDDAATCAANRELALALYAGDLIPSDKFLARVGFGPNEPL